MSVFVFKEPGDPIYVQVPDGVRNLHIQIPSTIPPALQQDNVYWPTDGLALSDGDPIVTVPPYAGSTSLDTVDCTPPVFDAASGLARSITADQIEGFRIIGTTTANYDFIFVIKLETSDKAVLFCDIDAANRFAGAYSTETISTQTSFNSSSLYVDRSLVTPDQRNVFLSMLDDQVTHIVTIKSLDITSAGYWFGRYNGTGFKGRYLIGDFAFGDFTDEEVADIESYLATKHGIPLS